ncbi:MAG: thiamine pyrophosphate-binding protein [Hyphomicrobium sp.]
MTKTVIEHVLSRLKDIGIDDIFGVPGDYAFPVNDAICNSTEVRWIGCANELNAGYAADGYARIKGVGALCTTYGVGELIAINAMAGAYAEHLPLFHLVGTPNMATQKGHKLVHHTLGTGEYDLFRKMTEPVVVASAVMTPENVAYETERLIFEALYHRRPVYMAFPADLAVMPVLGTAQPIPMPTSNPATLGIVADAITKALDGAKSAVALAGILIARSGYIAQFEELLAASNLPYATMFMGKTVIDEQHPNYVGMYDGALLEPEVRELVESAEVVINVGAPLTDFNSGAFTAKLDPARTIWIGHHDVTIGAKTYANIEMGDILAVLAGRLSRRDWPTRKPGSLGPVVGEGSDLLDAEKLYPRWGSFFAEGDIVMAETGTASMGLGFQLMPKGSNFYNQTLWGAIGWATPAALGSAVAAPNRRTVLVTGEGSHQGTAQDIGQFGRLGLKPIIFVLNNDGYLIERLLCKDPEIAYNDVAQWNYTELAHALGNEDWVTLRVTTCEELEDAFETARTATTGVYVEIVTGRYASSAQALKLHEAMQAIYKA